MPSTDPLRRTRIWNQFDEFGLLSGIPRIPGETNADYMKRLCSHEPYNASGQGMVNWLSDALLDQTYNVTAKTIFASLRKPISLTEYQRLEDKSTDFVAPQVIIGSDVWTLTSSTDTSRDTATVSGITWSLWKQPTGEYDQIWSTDSAPSDNVELKYQWKADNGALYIIREKPTLKSWVDGQIVEVDPNG